MENNLDGVSPSILHATDDMPFFLPTYFNKILTQTKHNLNMAAL